MLIVIHDSPKFYKEFIIPYWERLLNKAHKHDKVVIFHSDGFVEPYYPILIEAGLNKKKAAEIFVESYPVKNCCRILIEPEEEEFGPAIKTVNEIESVLDKSNIKIPRLLHGFNAVCWDMLREAARRGYDGRIGMEDTIYLENKEIVKSNSEFIQYANEIVRI